MRPPSSNPRFIVRVAEAIARRPWPAAALLVLLFGALAWSAVREKSSTFDEIAHLTAGTSYWRTNDYRMQPENGNLPQRWAGLPIAIGGAKFPDASDPHWRESNVWELGYDFFYTLGNDLDAMLWRGRGMIVLLGMALAAIVFEWSRRLFGTGGGFLSLAMFALCPSLLAHSALITSDVAAALWFTASLGAVWMALHRVSVWTVSASGLVLGALFVSKFSAVVILPVLVTLAVVRLVVNRPLVFDWFGRRSIVDSRSRIIAILSAVIVAQAALTYTTIWASYGFRYQAFAASATEQDHFLHDETITSLADNDFIGTLARFANEHQLLPESYLWGFVYTVKFAQARPAFFNGEYSLQGWRTFFPYAALVKTPLPTLLLLLLALAAALARWRWDSRGRLRGNAERSALFNRGLYRVLPLVLFLAIYWAIAIRSSLNIGHRHILPTYPAMFILGGAAVDWLRSSRIILRAVPTVAVIWLVLASLLAWPNYLAYFNPLAGGPRHAYRHLVESSLDWGQDLPGLKRWIERGHVAPQEPIYLSYFGVGVPAYYGLGTLELPSSPDWRKSPETGDLRPGVYCISATNLQRQYLHPSGPWTTEHEKAYQHLRGRIGDLIQRQQESPQLFSQLPADEAAAQEVADWQQVIREFEQYRFGRLCAYLRLREPDDNIGYSILVYRVTADDLQRALFRPLSDWPAVPPRSN